METESKSDDCNEDRMLAATTDVVLLQMVSHWVR